MKRKLRFMKL